MTGRASDRQGEAVGGGALCPGCVALRPAFAEARAVLRHDAGAKALVLPFKHRDRTEMAVPLARMMLRAGRAMLGGADALVPVPLHRWRPLLRRHDQAALLAMALGRLAGRPVQPGALERRRAPGWGGALKRRVALEGAFAVPPAMAPRVAGRRLVRVDDVLTIGATADACARALLAAGRRGFDAGRRSRPRSQVGRDGLTTQAGRARYRAMAEVEIYTTAWCPYCERAKALLARKGVSFTEHDAPHGSQERRDAIQRSGGRTTVPQIFINGESIGGSDELAAMDRAGKLDGLLAG